LKALGDEISKKRGGRPKKFDSNTREDMKQQLEQYNKDHSCGLQESEITGLAGYIAGGKLYITD
jgi:hypothetical protein